MNKNDILFEDQKDFIFKCCGCKQEILVEYGIEYNTQYARIDVEEITHPNMKALKCKDFGFICKDCLNKLKKEYGFERCCEI